MGIRPGGRAEYGRAERHPKIVISGYDIRRSGAYAKPEERGQWTPRCPGRRAWAPLERRWIQFHKMFGIVPSSAQTLIGRWFLFTLSPQRKLIEEKPGGTGQQPGWKQSKMKYLRSKGPLNE